MVVGFGGSAQNRLPARSCSFPFRRRRPVGFGIGGGGGGRGGTPWKREAKSRLLDGDIALMMLSGIQLLVLLHADVHGRSKRQVGFMQDGKG